MNKIIILDRDGVINVDSANFIKCEAEWIPIPGSLEAIAQLNHAGYTIAVATNQSGIARGLFDLDMLGKIHQKMYDSLAKVGGHIDLLVFCPHGPDENCACRKPKVGLFEQIAKHYHVDLKDSFIPCLGDSLRDILAANNFGQRPILLLTGNGPKTLKELPTELQNIEIYTDLSEATQALLEMP